MPLGIIATAMGTVLLPVYSRQSIEVSNDKILQTLNRSSRILFLIIPGAAVGLTLLAPTIVRTLFQWGGEFGEESLIQTYRALIFYAPGLIVFGWYKILAPFFYAYKDTKTPMKVAILCVGMNLVLNILFIRTWPTGYKHAGLACSTVISSTVNCTILACLIQKRYGSPNWKSIFAVLIKSLFAAFTMAVVIKLTASHITNGISSIITNQKATDITSLIAIIATGISAYILISVLLNKAEIKSLRKK
jgi:putative peptidoglycan lipid II flippase